MSESRTSTSSGVHSHGGATPFTGYGPYDARLARKRAQLDAVHALSSVVYLVRIGECIKIGTTANLHRRLQLLHAQRTDLLAVIPGGRDEERALHERFAASLHHGREWFTPTPDLIEYANQIRVAAGIAPVEA